LIAYAEYQFGGRVDGIAYRERENSGRLDNWDVEIVILFHLYEKLFDAYDKVNESMDMIALDGLIFPYLEKI
jgi:hypothetical protein